MCVPDLEHVSLPHLPTSIRRPALVRDTHPWPSPGTLPRSASRTTSNTLTWQPRTFGSYIGGPRRPRRSVK
ncbi:hypothetical protein LY76DRAFT_436830 [Colletotrichum caudatum]|nr:hypothetical protein LY76DRAFT_436830 [Colletotrichum caudatum]